MHAGSGSGFFRAGLAVDEDNVDRMRGKSLATDVAAVHLNRCYPDEPCFV